LYTEGLEIYGPDLLAFYANTLRNHCPNVARKSITPGMIKNYKHSSQRFWDALFGNVVWHCCTEDMQTSSSRKCTIHASINFNPDLDLLALPGFLAGMPQQREPLLCKGQTAKPGTACPTLNE